MNKRRLLKLADLLEADAKNRRGIKFDLDVIAVKSAPYAEDSSNFNDAYKFKEGETPTINCGTAACAVGLACISGAFKRSGLTYVITTTWGLEPVFDGAEGWGEAETEFFGLTHNESDFLFQAESYPRNKTKGAAGERYVAKRIRDFVAGKVSPS